jgi:hypothetical protein
MNVPYVKEYNDKGELLNPINGKYVNYFPNRQQRKPNRQRFFNNKKTSQLVTLGNKVYYKVLQYETDKEGKEIKIEHYLLKTK